MSRALCFWAEGFCMKFQGICSLWCQSNLRLILLEMSPFVAIRSRTSMNLITYVSLNKQNNLLISSGFKPRAEFPLDCDNLSPIVKLVLLGLVL